MSAPLQPLWHDYDQEPEIAAYDTDEKGDYTVSKVVTVLDQDGNEAEGYLFLRIDPDGEVLESDWRDARTHRVIENMDKWCESL